MTSLLKKVWNEIEIKTESNINQSHESNLLHLSIDKAQTLLKWSPKYYFEKAVLNTGEWYKRVQAGENSQEVTKGQIEDFMKLKLVY